jgi:uncharacterized protein
MGAQCLKNKDLHRDFFDTPGPAHYHTAPMSMPPDRPLDALGLARGASLVEREFPIAGFARLRDRLAEPAGKAVARAAFRLEGQWPVAFLTVNAEVVLVCQRCLGPMHRRLQSESRLVFAAEGSPELPDDFEAVDGDPRKQVLATLVEDELLLSLPLIAHHEAGEACTLPDKAVKPATEATPADMRRPFAGLKDLLKN